MSTLVKPSILLHLDTDLQPSVFDAVVAIDSGVDHLLRHGAVTPEVVEGLVHGLLFTRGLAELGRSAIFVGGGNVELAEAIYHQVLRSFFGPFRVSVGLDPNGCNTTASSVVLAILKAFDGQLKGVKVGVLAGTGPVGQRVARIVASQGAIASIGSRTLDRARSVADQLSQSSTNRVAGLTNQQLIDEHNDSDVLVSAGAAGAILLNKRDWAKLSNLKALIDVNAVPPVGIEGVEPGDKDTLREGIRCWGALGIGGTKMKIQRKAIQELFTSNTRLLDAEDIFALARSGL